MAETIRFIQPNLGDCIFDFDNKKVILNREGMLAEQMHLQTMTISFSDITDVEFRPGKLLKLPSFCFIVKGNRFMTDANTNATQMHIMKADVNRALDVLNRLVRECNLSGIKEYERSDVPKKVYDYSLTPENQKPHEFRMRCNVCGNVFCYSEMDIKNNEKLRQQANRERRMAVTSALGTTIIESNQHTEAADRYQAQIMDFSRCPKCHSTSLSELSEEEFRNAQNSMNQPVAPVASPIEEIKKFKELLDSGIITQEEFDTKKKQLLGL